MIILAGGHRSTISEDSGGIPKPMLPIGGRPLIWHIMKHASQCGINEFIVCGGYRIDLIKNYFLNFYVYQSDIEVNTADNTVKILKRNTEDWRVTVVDTGIETFPIERIKKVLDVVGDEFVISYGDCLSNISISDLINCHMHSNKGITVAVAKPSGRKVPLNFTDEMDIRCQEKAWISAGIFVAKRRMFENNQKSGDIEDVLLTEETNIYKHGGFFSTIETLRDKSAAENMWRAGKAPWMDKL